MKGKIEAISKQYNSIKINGVWFDCNSVKDLQLGQEVEYQAQDKRITGFHPITPTKQSKQVDEKDTRRSIKEIETRLNGLEVSKTFLAFNETDSARIDAGIRALRWVLNEGGVE